MTNEEAIKVLDEMMNIWHENFYSNEEDIAVDMAIKALETIPTQMSGTSCTNAHLCSESTKEAILNVLDTYADETYAIKPDAYERARYAMCRILEGAGEEKSIEQYVRDWLSDMLERHESLKGYWTDKEKDEYASGVAKALEEAINATLSTAEVFLYGGNHD